MDKKDLQQISFYRFYLKFLQLEIPNLLQIFTLISLLSLFSNNFYVRVFFVVLVVLLIDSYTRKKIIVLLEQEMLNPLSSLYITRVNFAKQSLHWEKEMRISSLITGFIFGIFLTVVSYIIKPF